MSLEDPQSRLKFIQSSIKSTSFSSCHNALILENERQAALKTEIEVIEQQIRTTPNFQDISLADVGRIKEEIAGNQEALEFFDSISSLEELFSQITTQISDRALKDSLISTTKDFESDVSTPKVKQCWNQVLLYSELVSIHTKDAADYHKFYHECADIRRLIERRWQTSSRSLNSLNVRGIMKDSKEIIKLIKEATNDLQSLADQINNLKRRCSSIVPIYLRTSSIGGQGRNALLLADIKIADIHLKKGEHVTVLDNWGKDGATNTTTTVNDLSSSRINWLVETKSHEKLLVPSVAIWIPGPDSETSLVLNELYNQLSATWDELLLQFREINFKFYQNLFQNIISKTEYSCSSKDLLLKCFKSTSKFVTSENSNSKLAKEFLRNMKTIENKIEIRQTVSSTYEGFHLRKQDLVLITELMIKFSVMEQYRKSIEIKSLNTLTEEWELSVETNLRVVNALGILQDMQHRNKSELRQILEHIEMWKQGTLNASVLDEYIKSDRDSPDSMGSGDSRDQYTRSRSSPLYETSDRNKFSQISVFCNFETNEATSLDKMYNEMFVSSANIDKNMELEPQIVNFDPNQLYKSRKRLQLKPYWDGNNLRITYFEVAPVVDGYSSSDEENLEISHIKSIESAIDYAGSGRGISPVQKLQGLEIKQQEDDELLLNRTIEIDLSSEYLLNENKEKEFEFIRRFMEVVKSKDSLPMLMTEINSCLLKSSNSTQTERIRKIETISIKDIVKETIQRDELSVLMKEINSSLSRSDISSQTDRVRQIQTMSIKDLVKETIQRDEMAILMKEINSTLSKSDISSQTDRIRKIETISIKDIVRESIQRNELSVLLTEINSSLSRSEISSQTDRIRKIETISIKDIVKETMQREEIPVLMKEINSLLSRSSVSSQTDRVRHAETISIKEIVKETVQRDEMAVLMKEINSSLSKNNQYSQTEIIQHLVNQSTIKEILNTIIDNDQLQLLLEEINANYSDLESYAESENSLDNVISTILKREKVERVMRLVLICKFH